MITLAWYLLKVIICSGILFGYYFLALRNKTFHRWNRFYLLAAFIAALAVPLIKINVFQDNADKGTVVQILQTISYGDEVVIEYNKSGFRIDSEMIATVGYVMISGIFLSIFLIALFRIRRLKKKFPETKIKDISFINTNAKGTPFSFFNAIFWNNAIDLHSKHGQKIFNHELAHIKEKHSYDKIFLNVVLIFFWVNPFFWLMRKELYMIHEFIADKESLEDNDLNAFAEMILQTVYPGQNFSIINKFFYSPIKRRLLMLTKNKNPKVSYASRLLVLPLAAIVFFAFTLKMKTIKTSPLYNGKTITVVIDGGHGGEDNGAVENNIKEKDLTLTIAKLVKELNGNKNINIILSRDKDESMSVKDRTIFANTKGADLFISIHIGAEEQKNLNSGVDIFIPKNDNKYLDQSRLLGSSIMETFKSNYSLPVANDLKQREKSLWVLKANQCPSVLIEAGFLTTQRDLDYLIKPSSQQAIARNILNGIENYAEQSLLNAGNINIPAANAADSLIGQLTIRPDTAHPVFYIDGKEISKKEMMKISGADIKSINVLKDKSAIDKYGDKGKDGVVEITTKNNDEGVSGTADTVYINGSSSKPISGNSKFTGNVIYFDSKIPDGVLIFADGKEISKDEMKSIQPNTIHSINVLKGETAEKKYGEKGKNGVIEVTTKYNIPPNTFIIIDGKESSRDELNKIQPNNIESITILKEGAIKKYGEKGRYGSVEIITKKASIIPSLKDTIPDKIFTKVENEASFPGGQSAWIKYITKIIQASLDSFTEADFGTCILKFIVNTNGTISNITATTMDGTNLAKIAINAIRKGPKWIPASQNGKTVVSYRLQPVTLMNPNAFNKFYPDKKQPANFAGGQTAWLKYITRVIQNDSNELIADKNNSGTCKVAFAVDKTGNVKDVQATNMKGTQLAELAVNIVKKAPGWNPGIRNGYTVNSSLIESVTFKVADKIENKTEPE